MLAEAWSDDGNGAGARDECEAGLGPGLEIGLELGMCLGMRLPLHTLTPSPCSGWGSEDPPRSKVGGNAGWIHYH